MADWARHARMSSVLEFDTIDLHLEAVQCNVNIGWNPIEANANTGAIQLLGNPVACIMNCFTLY
jgi:hypothetical protein